MAKVTFLGHSAWLIQNDQYSIIIDPFLEGNPTAEVKPDELNVDYIIVTHAHGDHLGDAIPMAKKNNATIISNFEIANYCTDKGANAHPMHIGGAHEFPFGKVKLTPAWHGSSFPDGSYGGTPAGCLVMIDGRTIYHTGDTGIFMDMQLIGELNPVDFYMVNIGDNFTMGIDDAVKSVELIKPRMTFPMHFKTMDVIDVDPSEFVSKVNQKGYEAKVIDIGASHTF
ncbi:MAG: metal-dependent hydrolase [Caldithrix sp.]|nr:metal-dependent hydrolase [Caldithrix sp.]